MQLETNRMILREFTPADAEKTYLYSIEKSRGLGIPSEVYASIEEAAENIAFIMSKYEQNALPLVLAIDLKESQEYIGHVSLSNIKHGVEVGYAVCERHQGAGYATEAVIAFVEWCRHHYRLDKIYGLAVPDNIASKRVLEKAGFAFLADDSAREYAKDRYIVYQLQF